MPSNGFQSVMKTLLKLYKPASTGNPGRVVGASYVLFAPHFHDIASHNGHPQPQDFPCMTGKQVESADPGVLYGVDNTGPCIQTVLRSETQADT